MAYRPIRDYGVIGDCHSAALVGLDGSVDWCCFPRFESPSVFAAILDDRKGNSRRRSRTSDSFLRHKSVKTNGRMTARETPDEFEHLIG